MDVWSRVTAFLDDWREAGEVPDSLPDLVRIHAAIAGLYRGLASHPGRVLAAKALLEDLWTEYERLLRRVGEEALGRALRHAGEGSLPASSGPGADGSQSADGRPLSGDGDLRQWAARHREAWIKSSPGLIALLDRVGPPPGELTGEVRGAELDKLREGASEEAMRELRLLPNEVQRAYLRLLTARLNALRVATGADAGARERISRMLGTIRDYTREHRPGAVYGLSRDHEPKGGTWEADAQYLWHRLVRDDEDAGPVSRSSPVRSGERPTAEDEEEERDAAPPRG